MTHTFYRPLFHFVLLLTWVLSLGAFAQEAVPAPQLQLPRLKMQAGMHQIDAQVAATPEQRQIGLMNRPAMPQHEGMLFVFERAAPQCFWMKNTLIPLTAAFIDEDGTVVNLVDMKPLSTQSHCSARPVRFVLEMNQGWFAHKKIEAGYKLQSSVFNTQK
jgi:uncharacterized membrane protein (UPF0127 family)